MLLTRLPLDLKEASFLLLSFDLHVLSTPPAFVLSQDQTLHDRSFVWLDYFLPCSNSLLGIATSHIGLIRSLYCSVFKEPSLFKRLDYLTTFISFCQMFFEIFFKVSFSFALSICLCSPLCRATYEIISHLLSSVNWFFFALSGSVWPVLDLSVCYCISLSPLCQEGFTYMERFQKGKRFRGSGFRVQGSGFRVVVAASLQYIWGDARR